MTRKKSFPPTCGVCLGARVLQPQRINGVRVGPKFPCPLCGRTKEEKKMAKIPTPFVGWRGRRYVFKTKTFKSELTGPRAKVETKLRDSLLPAWRKVAVKKGDEDVLALIDSELYRMAKASDDG